MPADDPRGSAAVAEAIDIYRTLDATPPDPYRGELARPLVNRAALTVAGGDRDIAVAAATEAAELAGALPAGRAQAVLAAAERVLVRFRVRR
jgi:hypothetical protein